ncbi:Enoyl-CoA hydratase/carnithine racemase [Thermomonospora echinospora]|uniref:Enoyl-CoA hydratase/carnithine racemase n=1 Tax=Thermomonospora echinospora TaxID=1992 RepID=A0A1H5SYS2_9ACTN|nr:enoyl-CoA hydratase-related protein [Thermomonospora echinospora]SEF55645.1 Enoyl-CoA hydratase/carnithine racemase [Thermomonospora echinospora]
MNDTEETVLVRHERSVAVITLNRPQALNAMTGPMSVAYARALREADADPQVRAIVVTGAGRGFCAGADLGVLNQGPDAIRALVPPAEDLPTMALRLRTPVIAAVNGPVAGIGFAYMMGSDVRFAGRGVKMTTSFSRLGLVAEYGLSWLLPRLIGASRAMELLLSGRTLDAEEAERIGLVHRVVEPDRVLQEAVDYAADLAAGCAPSSLAAIKAQVYADLERSHDDALADTLKLMDASFGGPDLAEALAARKEKRPPVFTPLH